MTRTQKLELALTAACDRASACAEAKGYLRSDCAEISEYYDAISADCLWWDSTECLWWDSEERYERSLAWRVEATYRKGRT